MPAPLPDDASVFTPSDKIESLPKETENSFQTDPGAQELESFGGILSYPGQILSAITGRDAPIEFPDLPELLDMPSADTPGFFRRVIPNIQAMMTTDDLGKTEIFEAAFRDDEKWGGAFVDDFGLPIIIWNDIPYYVNKPGLGGTDFSTFLGEVLKYAPASGFVGRAKSIPGVVGRGAIAYPTTEAVAKLGESVLTPKTVASKDQTIEELGTEIGTLAAQDIAIDVTLPKALTVLGKTIEVTADKSGNVAKSLVEKAKKVSPFPKITPDIIQRSRFPLTLGQKYSPVLDPKDKRYTKQLATEDELRFGPAGGRGSERLRAFDERQIALIREDAEQLQREMGAGVIAEEYSGIPGVAADEIQKIISGLKSQKEEASQEIYDALKQIRDEKRPKFGKDAIKNISQKMMDYVTINEGIYPSLLEQSGTLKTTYDFLKRINRQAGKKKFEDQTVDSIQRFRSNLGYKIGNAPLGSDDKRILTRLKAILDEGIDDSITRGFVSGDPDFIDQLKQASDLYSEYNSLVGGRAIPALKKLPEKERKVQKVLRTLGNEEYTTMEVVNLLFGQNKFKPDNSMPLVIDELKRILPENEFGRVQALLKDGILTKAFGGKDGKITRLALTQNFDSTFRDQKDIIEKLFSPEEVKRIKELKEDVMPTLAAELKRNASDTAYVLQGTLERLGMHSVPQFGLTPDARVARALLERGVEALSSRKQENYAQAAVRAVIKEMRTPLLSKEVRLGLIDLPIKVTAEELVQAGVRGPTREEAEPEKPSRRERETLEKSIENLRRTQKPQASISIENMFPPLPQTPGASPSNVIDSPTLLPSDQDRELARRLQGGIGGLGAIA